MEEVRLDWSDPSEERLASFCADMWAQGHKLYRDLPWRHTHDPYEIWLSEVMLQQTQVTRVDGRWQRWLDRFPTLEALAHADRADVLEEWQGMGYNRRALALLHAAQLIVDRGGTMPRDMHALMALPGIGPATAAGIRAFAWNLPGVYLETNVRSVFLHEFFSTEVDVPDRRIVPLVEKTCPADVASADRGPRAWYYALLDVGAYLKATQPNPSRRSRTHVRQSRFEGSHRQKRAELLRLLLAHRHEGGATVALLAEELSREEKKTDRLSVSREDVFALLKELEGEGFCRSDEGLWRM